MDHFYTADIFMDLHQMYKYIYQWIFRAVYFVDIPAFIVCKISLNTDSCHVSFLALKKEGCTCGYNKAVGVFWSGILMQKAKYGIHLLRIFLIYSISPSQCLYF